MSESKFLKNPVLRNKFEMKIENPSGNVLEEIKEQDILAQSGGVTATLTNTCLDCYTVVSIYLGNQGAYCTLSLECQKSGCGTTAHC